MTRISLERGELYFIGERDKRSGDRTPYVKIGLVGSTRTSEDRLLDHRTANPRELVVHAIVPTPLVSWAENTIHKQFGTQRIQGEWFVLDDAQLASAITEARALAATLGPLEAGLAEAQRLRECESDGSVIAASEEVHGWLQDLRTAKARLDHCEELDAGYSTVVRALVEAGEVGAEIASTKTIDIVEFDEAKFKENHPELWERFVVEKDRGVRPLFRPATRDLPTIDEVDPELAAFGRAFRERCTDAATDPGRIEVLKDAFLELDWRAKAATLELRVATARIQVACGTAEGIDGVCSWKRTRKVERVFDTEMFAAADPELYSKFLVTRQISRTTKNRKGHDNGSTAQVEEEQ